MTYIKITNRCSMSCIHCCNNSHSRGKHMSMEVFRKALEYCDDCVCLGGGEPTMHPKFEQILCETIAHSYDVQIITNGANKPKAMLLSKLHQKNILHTELSQDEYHDPIDSEVVNTFKKLKAIRNTSYNEFSYEHKMPIWAGRAKLNFDKDDCQHICPCEDIVIKPNGTAYQCGCDDSPIIGNVYDGFDIRDYGCHKEIIKF